MRPTRLIANGLFLAVFILTGVNSALVEASYPELPGRFDQLSNSVANESASHLIGFGIDDVTDQLGSIEVQFCSNNPFPGDACTAPGGLDASGFSINPANETGETGFTRYAPGTNANTIVLTRTPSVPVNPAGSPNTYPLDNIINPASNGTLYARVYIYSDSTASTTPTESGGIAISINPAVIVSSEVPPYIIFCTATIITGVDCSTATTYSINLGDLSTQQASPASSQFVVSTNATSGYNISYSGSSLISDNNIIPSLTAPTSSRPGTSQFGINLRANTSPVVGQDPFGSGTGNIDFNYSRSNLFDFGSGDELVSWPSYSDKIKFTVSYLTNISSGQAPGVYATTITYICLANF